MGAGLSVIRGACGHDCPDTCTWMVEVNQGRAEKLYGDPDHPFTRGSLCGKVNHYLERVYHPDRVLHPLKRVGKKGEAKFVRVSWDEALSDIAARWKAIIQESGAEAILPFSTAGNQSLLASSSLDFRFFGVLGASQIERSICGVVAHNGIAATQGAGTGVNPEDFVHSRLIVLWGTNTIVTNMHLWPIILEARQRGAKIVVIDPIRTRTAEAADWHIAPRPGTDAALALGMMHVIIRDNHVDHDYVEQYATGYSQLAERAQQYPPARVAEITGLSVDVIEQLAKEYATTTPSLLRPLIGLEHHHNGAMTFRTIACLPVLIGAWRHRGGGLSRSTHALQYSTLNMNGLLKPEVHVKGTRTLNMVNLGHDLCSTTLSPPVRSLVVYNANPAATLPNQVQVLRGLEREDLLTIVHDLFITDTARYADYVLPATSQIEHLDLVPAWGHHYLSLNRPAIEPQGESVCNTELFRRLARAMGRTESHLFESDEQLLRTALDSGHPMLQGITLDGLMEHGYLHLTHEEDWRPFAKGGFPTASGRAELYSEGLERMGIDPLPSPGAIRVASDSNYPLQLITGKTLFFLNSSYSHMDWHCRRAGVLEVWIHPDDAASRGLTDDQQVSVVNAQGSVHAVCRITDKVSAGVTWMPFGGLMDATQAAGNVNVLTPEEPTDWAGGSGFYDAFVDVRRTNAP